MRVVRRPRAALLAPLIRHLGYFQDDLPHRYEQILPTGAQDLMVNLDRDRFWAYDPAASSVSEGPVGKDIQGAVFGGATYAPTVADTADQRAIFNVHFALGGAYPFFGGAAADATGGLVELDALWGTGGSRLRERLLEAPTIPAKLDVMEKILLDRLLAAGYRGGADVPVEAGYLPDPAIAYAVRALSRGVPVADVADALGWTSKRLVRRFTTQVGLGPKRFARVRRLQRVLRSVEDRVYETGGGPDWARVAYEHGFYDQAHFVNDFKTLTGITPTAYQPRARGERNHIPLERRSGVCETSARGRHDHHRRRTPRAS